MSDLTQVRVVGSELRFLNSNDVEFFYQGTATGSSVDPFDHKIEWKVDDNGDLFYIGESFNEYKIVPTDTGPATTDVDRLVWEEGNQIYFTWDEREMTLGTPTQV